MPEWYEFTRVFNPKETDSDDDNTEYIIKFFTDYKNSYQNGALAGGRNPSKGEQLLLKKLDELVNNILDSYVEAKNPYLGFYNGIEKVVEFYTDICLKNGRRIASNLATNVKNREEARKINKQNRDKVAEVLQVMDDNMGVEIRKVLKIIRKEKAKQIKKKKN